MPPSRAQRGTHESSRTQRRETGSPLVAVRGVTHVFGEKVTALDRVDFDVKEEEFVCILGPSGCGKSTLLSLIAGLFPPSSGTIERAGSIGEPGGIGMVFQSPVLLPWRTVFKNVVAPAEVLGIPKSSAAEGARTLLERIGLAGFENAYPHELSGGMQQRVAIARALLSDPPLLLMDEPFGALDAMTREDMNLDLLRVWRETKKTVVLVTHSLDEAAFLADRVIVMAPRPGRVMSVQDISLDRPRSIETLVHRDFVSQVASLRKVLYSV